MNKTIACSGCDKIITSDEVALSKKLINRGTKDFFCINCLSEFFNVSQTNLENKIVYYKKFGRTLFIQNES